MLRSIVSVFAGYLSMTIATMVLFAGLAVMYPDRFSDPDTFPSGGTIAVILMWGFLSAWLGGLVTVMLARHSEAKHVLGLVVLVVILGFVSLAMNAPAPFWYRIGIIAVGALGVHLGGRFGIQRKAAKA